MSKTSHYKANTKRGFEAGELAALLARHSPDADYRVVISFKGRVRELIVQEEGDPSPFVLKEVPRDRDAGGCETPGHTPGNDCPPDRIPGGSMRRGWDAPRTQDFQPEGQTWPAAPPWPEAGSLS